MNFFFRSLTLTTLFFQPMPVQAEITQAAILKSDHQSTEKKAQKKIEKRTPEMPKEKFPKLECRNGQVDGINGCINKPKNSKHTTPH